MSLSALYVAVTERIVSLMDGSHAFAHTNAGLLIYVVVQLISRERRASEHALIAVLGLELANEMMEAAHYGALRLSDTGGDILMTMLWPTVLFVVARVRRRRWATAMALPAPGAEAVGRALS